MSTHTQYPPQPIARRVAKMIKTIWKAFSDILANDRVVPREVDEPEKGEDKKSREDQDAVDQALFRRQVHEDGADQSDLNGGNKQGDGDVCLARTEVDVGKRDGKTSRSEQDSADN